MQAWMPGEHWGRGKHVSALVGREGGAALLAWAGAGAQVQRIAFISYPSPPVPASLRPVRPFQWIFPLLFPMGPPFPLFPIRGHCLPTWGRFVSFPPPPECALPQVADAPRGNLSTVARALSLRSDEPQSSVPLFKVDF